MNDFCVLCWKPKECTHHLVFGRGKRELAEKDGLTIRLCHSCHNLAISPVDRIHGNSAAEQLSKMLGQMQFERDFIAQGNEELKAAARKAFKERYGINYL